MSGVEQPGGAADLSAALRESEERLRLIQAAARIGSFDWDMRTGQIFRSPEYLALQGLPADLGRTGEYSDAWIDRVHPDDRDQVRAWAATDLQTPGDFAREYRIIRPDTGEARWIYSRGSVSGDAEGRPLRMVCAQTDVTDRKLGELRSRYLAGLVDALRAAETPADAMRTAAEHLGRYLGADQGAIGPVLTEAVAALRAPEKPAQPVPPGRWTDHELAIIRTTAERTSDAVERAKAEEALRVSEERMRLAAEGTGLGFFDLDMRTGEGVWSQNAFRMLGLEPTPDLRARHDFWVGRLHPADQDEMVAARDAAEQRGGYWSLEHRIIRADDGQVRWLATYGLFLGPAEARRSIGVAIDITERKEAELRQALLLQVADQLRGAADMRAAIQAVAAILARELDVAMAGFAQIDDAGQNATIFSASNRAGAQPGPTDVPIGRDRGPLRGVSARDLVRGRTFIVSDMAKDGRTSSEAAAIRAGAGVAAAIQVPVMRGDRLGGMLFVHSDRPRDWSPTEVQTVEEVAARIWEAVVRLRAEIALQHANERLASEVERAVEARETALAQLHQAQKLETIGKLTGEIAHDFNNLLTPITGALDLLRHRFQADARLSRLIDGGLQSAERARVLVQRLLGFARRQPLTPVAVDVASLLGGMTDLIESSVGRGIAVHIDAEADLPPALADANQLELALLNLCVNARDAMPEGGTIAIAATVANGADIGLSGDAYLRLTVADTGAGMDEATRAQAIEPFFSTKPKERGTGLGLSMVHGLAAQLGGALTIDSARGEGTRVQLWLPIAPDATARPRAQPAGLDEVTPTASLSVLLVDDEQLVREMVAEMLRDLGHDVAQAASGAAALAQLNDNRFDLIITDYMMPGMDGGELAARIAEASPGMPVLLITGFIGSAGNAGDLPRLAKPFGREELAGAIATLPVVPV